MYLICADTMSVRFSDQLKDQHKTYMKHRHGVVISDAQAQLDLLNMSELHMAFFPTNDTLGGDAKPSPGPLVR